MVDLNFLPKLPGIYIFKDKEGQVIYIGKAKSIRKRVSSYFQRSHLEDKVAALISEYGSIEFIVTKNETEALLLEAKLIGDFKPRFNILLKEGQPFLYIVFTENKKDLSKIVLSRNKDLKGVYFGPFLHKFQARKMFEYLVSTFRLNICNKKVENGCLDYHIGLCAGSCKPDFDVQDYLFRLNVAQDALKKEHKKILSDLKVKIEMYNKNMEFEKSRNLQEYVDNIDVILHTIETKFTEDKFEDKVFAVTTKAGKIYSSNRDVGLQLGEFLKIKNTGENIDVGFKEIKSIDCFDISHFQGSFIVGSCVRFTNGHPEKNKFRKFKIKLLENQNDYAALQEIVSRRYREGDFPDVIMIDGGKGQLNSILSLEVIKNGLAVDFDINGNKSSFNKLFDVISLAKREETIYSQNFPEGIKLDQKSDLGLLLIALRDYAHHFAITYHRKRRSKQF